ncbi:hypothetical protein E2C01_102026 [Portunus trituberculatus]|uniref:Uncharacterized protein n=1 Tax=Portunus trituberculatus TaxID=210409 RepID=A0A5B7KHG9_PORTR|nr:hypothetical protein [Portunus trituberculatus]
MVTKQFQISFLVHCNVFRQHNKLALAMVPKGTPYHDTIRVVDYPLFSFYLSLKHLESPLRHFSASPVLLT